MKLPFKEFIKCLFIPRKMSKLRNINPIISLLLIAASCFISVSTSPIYASTHKKELSEMPDEVFLVEDSLLDLVNLEIEDNKLVSSNQLKEYTTTISKDNVTYNVEYTIIVDSSISEYGSRSNLNYDLSGYFTKEKDDNTIYVLFLFTESYLYISYNKDLVCNSTTAYDTICYMCNDDGDVLYYLPLNETEIETTANGIDYTLWSNVVSSTDTITINGVNYSPVKKFVDSIYGMLYGKSISYEAISSATNSNTIPLNSLKVLNDYMFDMASSVYGTQIVYGSIVLSYITNIFLALIMVLFLFVTSKNMLMNKFKNYLSIYAVTFTESSIVIAIIGIFVPYVSTSTYMVFITVLWFIVCCLEINRMKDFTDADKPKGHGGDESRPTFKSDTAMIG